MHGKTVEAMRAVLTVTGLVLLFIFGARAAGQARDMSLAGANHRSVLPTVSIANVTHLNPWLVAVPTAARAVMSERAAVPASSHASQATAPNAADTQAQINITTTDAGMNLQVQSQSTDVRSDQQTTIQQTDTQSDQGSHSNVAKQKRHGHTESTSTAVSTATTSTTQTPSVAQ